MILNLLKKELVVFDLDDTLYKEYYFLESAFNEISTLITEGNSGDIYAFMLNIYKNNGDPFGEVIKEYRLNLSKGYLISLYRRHVPSIELEKHTREFIVKLKNRGCIISVLTDGRSITQRNKLNALNIMDLLDDIIISEEFGSSKPDIRNFKYFESKYVNHQKTYIGDNFSKDFITPNSLGWRTIGLIDNGINIHRQDTSLPIEYLPQNTIHTFNDIIVNYE